MLRDPVWRLGDIGDFYPSALPVLSGTPHAGERLGGKGARSCRPWRRECPHAAGSRWERVGRVSLESLRLDERDLAACEAALGVDVIAPRGTIAVPRALETPGTDRVVTFA